MTTEIIILSLLILSSLFFLAARVKKHMVNGEYVKGRLIGAISVVVYPSLALYTALLAIDLNGFGEAATFSRTLDYTGRYLIHPELAALTCEQFTRAIVDVLEPLQKSLFSDLIVNPENTPAIWSVVIYRTFMQFVVVGFVLAQSKRIAGYFRPARP